MVNVAWLDLAGVDGVNSLRGASPERLTTFSNSGVALANTASGEAAWPFAEPLPPRPVDSDEGR